MVKLLIDNEADVHVTDGEGYSSLQIACGRDMVPMVKMLIEGGADVNGTDGEGWTLLNMACHWGNESMVKMLIESDAVVNISHNFGMSPLHSACRLSENLFRSIVPMLILAGADTRARDGEGRLPIDLIEDDRCRAIYKEAEAQVESQALKPVLK
jgi:ankyrin repeat protein